MKTNKNTLLNTLRAIVVMVALIFTSNINAATLTSVTLNATISTNMSITSAKMHALTWGSFWNWLFNNNDDHHHYGDGQDCNGGSSDSIPLDGGLSILAIGAVAFGVKKLRENKNDKA